MGPRAGTGACPYRARDLTGGCGASVQDHDDKALRRRRQERGVDTIPRALVAAQLLRAHYPERRSAGPYPTLRRRKPGAMGRRRGKSEQGVRMTAFSESVVEQAALAWLEALGYAVLHGPAIAAGQPGAERADPGYRDVVLEGRLRQALARLNPDLPPEALDDAYRKLTGIEASSLL